MGGPFAEIERKDGNSPFRWWSFWALEERTIVNMKKASGVVGILLVLLLLSFPQCGGAESQEQQEQQEQQQQAELLRQEISELSLEELLQRFSTRRQEDKEFRPHVEKLNQRRDELLRAEESAQRSEGLKQVYEEFDEYDEKISPIYDEISLIMKELDRRREEFLQIGEDELKGLSLERLLQCSDAFNLRGEEFEPIREELEQRRVRFLQVKLDSLSLEELLQRRRELDLHNQGIDLCQEELDHRGVALDQRHDELLRKGEKLAQRNEESGQQLHPDFFGRALHAQLLFDDEKRAQLSEQDIALLERQIAAIDAYASAISQCDVTAETNAYLRVWRVFGKPLSPEAQKLLWGKKSKPTSVIRLQIYAKKLSEVSRGGRMTIELPKLLLDELDKIGRPPTSDGTDAVESEDASVPPDKEEHR